MELTQRLDELRRLFYQPPGGATWDGVMAALYGHSHDPGLGMALDYAREHLRAWPDELRSVPFQYATLLHKRRVLLPAMELVRNASLELDRLHHAGLAWLLEQPRVARWRWLHIRGGRCGEVDARTLASAPFPDSVHHLGMQSYTLRIPHAFTMEGATWEALASNPRFARLRQLDLASLRWSNDLAQSVSRQATRLRSLRLHQCLIQPGQLRAVLHAPVLEELRRLELSGNATSPWSNLRARPDAATPQMEALLSSPWLERLEALHLSYADATAENLRRFALDPRFQGLEELSLRACRLGRDEVEALCAGPWPRLKALNLSHDALSPRALEPLLSHGLRARLKSFSLSGHGLGEAGLGALGARGPWSALESLEVCSTTIDGYDNSMTSQAALPHLTAEAFPALRRLSLARVQWTSEPADVLRLLAALPSLRWLHLPMAVDRSLRDELTEQAQARCCQLVFW